MLLTTFIIIISTILLAHSIFNLLITSFSWDDPYTLHQRKSPKNFRQPHFSFTILLPVRNEAAVIGDTLKAMTLLNYPIDLYEVFVLCRTDDIATLQAIKKAAAEINPRNITLVVLNNGIDNKPKSLNVGLAKAANQIVAVFDAEDEPHPDILQIINTKFLKSKTDVVQSGVQLMNYTSQWFSTMNVLEYYFWFKSSLHFFTRMGVVPLGGNTVFIKRSKLEAIGGWDERILTEDADVGIRLSLHGAKIDVVYDEKHVTKEETPATVAQFIKQRTRWNQGFLQIFFNLHWLRLPGLKQKLFTAYLLFMPLLQALWVLYLPLTIVANFVLNLPVGWAIFSLLPGYVLVAQFILYNYGLYRFSQSYYNRYSPFLIFRLLITFFPYQFLLSVASLRALIRFTFGEAAWEKTRHHNNHRKGSYET